MMRIRFVLVVVVLVGLADRRSNFANAQPDDLFWCVKSTVPCYEKVGESCELAMCEGYVEVADGLNADICTTSKIETECIVDGSCGTLACRRPELFVPAVAPLSNESFNIQLVLASGATLPEGSEILFVAAAQKWMQIITADIPSEEVPGIGVIDDVLILVGFTTFSSAGVLGAAGPRWVRSADNYFQTAFGQTVFNIALFDAADQSYWYSVILHEIGHVLGLGALWPTDFNGFVNVPTGTTGCTNEYTASRGGAKAAYLEAGGLLTDALNGNVPPVETMTGRVGSDCGHWSFALFPELMCFAINQNFLPPLSKITIGALYDLGYEVDYSQAEPYNINRASFALLQSVAPAITERAEMIRPKIERRS